MNLARRSRPISSVPSGWVNVVGANGSEKFNRYGSRFVYAAAVKMTARANNAAMLHELNFIWAQSSYARLPSAVSGTERLTISRNAKLDWIRATFGRRDSCVLWMCS